MSKSKMKMMLICFFDVGGIIHFEFVSEGTTVNQTFYVEVLASLRVSQFSAGKGISAMDHVTWLQPTSGCF
jgi:hypothetical protein